MSSRKKIRGAIVKKDEKAQNIITMLGNENSEEHFISKFIEVYPDECKRYRNAHREQEESRKPGKKIPMSTLEIYLKNLYKKMNK